MLLLAGLTFAGTLLVASLLSEAARKVILSTAVLFLAVGFLAGSDAIGWLAIPPQATLLIFVELTLFVVLFTDAMELSLEELLSAWRLPGRALLFGMPLTLLGTAALAHWLTDIGWLESLLLGAVLAPTDPVLAAALIGREEIPFRLRLLLNIESGVNDGLALPAVLVLLALLGEQSAAIEAGPPSLAAAMIIGIGIGILIPWMAVQLRRLPFLSAAGTYEPIYGFSIALLVLTTAQIIEVNLFLAAFAAGVTLATVGPEITRDFHPFGQFLAELFKLSALLVFGVIVATAVFPTANFGTDLLFVLLVLFVVRPLALGLALLGSGLPTREWLAAAWFGPRGFASIVFALLVRGSDFAASGRVFELAALVIVGSILLHSSTDVLVARWFRTQEDEQGDEQQADRKEGQPEVVG